MVVGVAVTVAQLISVGQVWLMASGALGQAGVVFPDIAACTLGKPPPTHRSIIVVLECIQCMVSLRGTVCGGDVHEAASGCHLSMEL